MVNCIRVDVQQHATVRWSASKIMGWRSERSRLHEKHTVGEFIVKQFVVIPAVDIRAGRCVRLMQGRYECETVYDDDPAHAARRWEAEGAEWLHIVDLDGAREGSICNWMAIERIRHAVECYIEVGGSIRTMEDIQRLINIGIERVVLGTIAIENPELLEAALDEYGQRIAVAVDVKNERVAVRGWLQTTGWEPLALMRNLKRMGVSWVIYTDVHRDGVMSGPNIEAIRCIAEMVDIHIIASGGISTVEHILTLARLFPKVAGCIVGRALYEGKLSYRDAVAAISKP